MAAVEDDTPPCSGFQSQFAELSPDSPLSTIFCQYPEKGDAVAVGRGYIRSGAGEGAASGRDAHQFLVSGQSKRLQAGLRVPASSGGSRGPTGSRRTSGTNHPGARNFARPRAVPHTQSPIGIRRLALHSSAIRKIGFNVGKPWRCPKYGDALGIAKGIGVVKVRIDPFHDPEDANGAFGGGN